MSASFSASYSRLPRRTRRSSHPRRSRRRNRTSLVVVQVCICVGGWAPRPLLPRALSRPGVPMTRTTDGMRRVQLRPRPMASTVAVSQSILLPAKAACIRAVRPTDGTRGHRRSCLAAANSGRRCYRCIRPSSVRTYRLAEPFVAVLCCWTLSSPSALRRSS